MRNRANALGSIGVYFVYIFTCIYGLQTSHTSTSFGERQESCNVLFLARDTCRNQELSVPRRKWRAETWASIVDRTNKPTRKNSINDWACREHFVTAFNEY